MVTTTSTAETSQWGKIGAKNKRRNVLKPRRKHAFNIAQMIYVSMAEAVSPAETGWDLGKGGNKHQLSSQLPKAKITFIVAGSHPARPSGELSHVHVSIAINERTNHPQLLLIIKPQNAEFYQHTNLNKVLRFYNT